MKRGLAFLPGILIIAAVAGILTYVIFQASTEENDVDVTDTSTVVHQNANTANTALDTWEAYTNTDIGVTFEYPKSWGPIVEEIEAGSDGGYGARINFSGSGGDLSLYYNSADFAVGRETFPEESIGLYQSVFGIERLCDVVTWDYPHFDVIRYCTIANIGNRQTGTMLTHINALGGDYIMVFRKLFAFETRSSKYPAGALVLSLPAVNDPHYPANSSYTEALRWGGYATADVQGVDDVYTSINDRTADSETSTQLEIFDRILSSFQFTD